MFSPDENTTIAFREFLSALSVHAPRLVMTLPNSATRKHISDTEQRLNIVLPDALKALHAVHHGEGRGVGSRPLFKTLLFRQTAFLPLTGDEGIQWAWKQTQTLGNWIPFAGNGAGSWHGIVPEDDETQPGAIIYHDMNEGSRVVASSMVDFLNGLTKKINRKRWKANDDELQVVTAKIYAAEHLPFDQIVPHPDLNDQQVQLIRVRQPEDDAQTFLDSIEPGHVDTWSFLIESTKDLGHIVATWRDDQGRAHYPCRSQYSIRRVQGRSQRHYLLSAPKQDVDQLHLEIRVEYHQDET